MKKAEFLYPAENEMLEAAEYYERQVKGLGSAFLREVQRAVKAVENNPEIWEVVRGNVRRRLVKRFPYGILYRIEPIKIIVVAVMHLHRNPNYWYDR
ncbi:putative toxin-antitoxin system, toxin component, RelE/ParE-like [Desulfonema limicola]|uniref:Toxin-antitoxin system, toxin component, RelE/ParE-like n=1 Tax=Desulfonema limicola TaxID=45656 RepID=A0A975B7M9_9BACT|nr:type II toxin-antitoxin system RelE/ParE family toxin [Desulfonema limicola]QTA80419.1 putative toxin-antitoxin system, toxin component, RelE/ParE-like [Desulfonema limicola]